MLKLIFMAIYLDCIHMLWFLDNVYNRIHMCTYMYTYTYICMYVHMYLNGSTALKIPLPSKHDFPDFGGQRPTQATVPGEVLTGGSLT